MAQENQLTPDLVLRAYSHGYFPMADGRGGEIAWYNPDPRAILPLDGMRISRSLRKRLRSGCYRVTFDKAFPRVISECAAPRDYAADTWINYEIISVYTALHRMGFAHSVEAWQDDPECGESELVGGLYGIAIGSGFFGESMFSRESDASKVCLAHLVDRLRTWGFTLLDTQLSNPHMESLGVVEVPQEAYLTMLDAAVRTEPRWPTSATD